jgi:hypothetical protein
VLDALVEHRVAFVVIGGVALVLHGSSRVTQDLDICYARDADNLERLATALQPFRPILRGAPPDLPFTLDARSLSSGLNFTLATEAGDLDILGDVPGAGGYDQLAADAVPMEVYGHRILVMSLSALEKAKHSAGRLKDLADLAEIRELRGRSARN